MKKPKHAGNIVPSIDERYATHAVTNDVSRLKMKPEEAQRGHAIGMKAATSHAHNLFNPTGKK